MNEKGLTFQVELPAGLCQVNADVRRLRWAIINLMRNAWQYTPANGQVRLQLSAHNGQVALAVTDTGIGISTEKQQQIFGRFYRATGETDDAVRGLGLGLYVTKAIVEAHGGEVHMDSQEGVGSTFCLILPALQTGKGETDATRDTAASK